MTKDNGVIEKIEEIWNVKKPSLCNGHHSRMGCEREKVLATHALLLEEVQRGKIELLQSFINDDEFNITNYRRVISSKINKLKKSLSPKEKETEV